VRVLFNIKSTSGSTGIDDLGKIKSCSNSYLKQNHPNPFSQETVIDYYLAQYTTNAQIIIFDMTGKLIKSYPAQQGEQSLYINSIDFIPGMYYYSLVIEGVEFDTKKMILSK
jgi:hypothetical protein